MKRLRCRRGRANGGGWNEETGLKLGLGGFSSRKDEGKHWRCADLRSWRRRQMGRHAERAVRLGLRDWMDMHGLNSRGDGKHQYDEHHRPFHGRCAIELAFPFHALRMRGAPN